MSNSCPRRVWSTLTQICLLTLAHVTLPEHSCHQSCCRAGAGTLDCLPQYRGSCHTHRRICLSIRQWSKSKGIFHVRHFQCSSIDSYCWKLKKMTKRRILGAWNTYEMLKVLTSMSLECALDTNWNIPLSSQDNHSTSTLYVPSENFSRMMP